MNERVDRSDRRAPPPTHPQLAAALLMIGITLLLLLISVLAVDEAALITGLQFIGLQSAVIGIAESRSSSGWASGAVVAR